MLRTVEPVEREKPESAEKFLQKSLEAGVRSRDRFTIEQMPRVKTIDIDCGTVAYDDFTLDRERRQFLVTAGYDAVAQAFRQHGAELRASDGRARRPEVKSRDTDRDAIAQHRGEELLSSYTRNLSITSRDKVFVSYSHEDSHWLGQLLTHLAPVQRNGGFEVWVDSDIQPGTNWRAEIAAATGASKVAVLLVSKNFLASDFIMNEELPALTDASRKGRIRILCVPVSPSSWQETELERLQWAVVPERTLSSLSESERDRVLVQVCSRIKEAMA